MGDVHQWKRARERCTNRSRKWRGTRSTTPKTQPPRFPFRCSGKSERRKERREEITRARPPNLIRKNNYFISLLAEAAPLSFLLFGAHSRMHTHRFHPAPAVILLRPARPPVRLSTSPPPPSQLPLQPATVNPLFPSPNSSPSLSLTPGGYFERPRGREPNMTN